MATRVRIKPPTSESEALTTRPPLTPVKVVIPIFAIYKLVSIRFNHSSIIMRPFLKQIWRCMYMYELAHPHIFSYDNYHFYGREILQYEYIARTCLRNGFLNCLTSQSTIFPSCRSGDRFPGITSTFGEKICLLKYTTWRPELGSCVVPLPSLQEAEVKNKIRGSLEKKKQHPALKTIRAGMYIKNY